MKSRKFAKLTRPPARAYRAFLQNWLKSVQGATVVIHVFQHDLQKYAFHQPKQPIAFEDPVSSLIQGTDTHPTNPC
jgi:hypothetical protein